MTVHVQTCTCCGLLQRLPDMPATRRCACARCGSRLARPSGVRRHRQRTTALALAALLLYPPAVGLPLLQVQQFGYVVHTSVLDGVASLFAAGDFIIGTVVLLCSVILPLGKLLAMLLMVTGTTWLRLRHRALTWRVIEWTGRWGMLDVLAVAVLVAALKLGHSLQVTAGPGALAFVGVVVLSLCASASFDIHDLWEPDDER
jgi:paraquat-inducible protein A